VNLKTATEAEKASLRLRLMDEARKGGMRFPAWSMPGQKTWSGHRWLLAARLIGLLTHGAQAVPHSLGHELSPLLESGQTAFSHRLRVISP